MSGLSAALRGDIHFLAAIDAADADTFGISCPCGTYHVGKFIDMDPRDAVCPSCGCDHGAGETPALGTGPASLNAKVK